MHFLVTKIEFDLDDDYDMSEEDTIKFKKELQLDLQEKVIGLWYVDSECGDPEDELIEKITDKTGWCIKSIKYCENRPHRLTSYK